MEKKITMFTDGGSRGNPGPSAIGIYIQTLEKKYHECIGMRTNNEAEYEALIFGLKKIKQLVGKGKIKNTVVECFLDSELVVKQLNHEYKLNDGRIREFFLEIWNLTIEFEEVKFIHVRREKNKVADALVNEALDAQFNQAKLI